MIGTTWLRVKKENRSGRDRQPGPGSVAPGDVDRPVVEVLDRVGQLLGQLVDPAPRDAAAAGAGAVAAMGSPTTRWMCRGRGSRFPLGITDAEPPIPTGTTVAPVRAARKATPSCRSSTTGPGPPLAFGEQDQHLPGLQHLLGPAERLPVGRLPVDGEGPDGGEDPGQQRFFHRLSLAM